MKLFEEFKRRVPNNEDLIKEVLEEEIGSDKINSEYIKDNFSKLVEIIHNSIYEKYLCKQKEIGNDIITKHIEENNNRELFLDFNDFYMSIFQSRKVRAGKVFESIIGALFKKCNYPFEEQIIINGKPDFLLPSEEAYRNNPMDCIIFTAKRTLRERWRQIVTEGTKAYGFFLTTLDEDITGSQLNEMKNNKIYIVLPKKRIEENANYMNQTNVISYEDFFEDFLDPAVKRWERQKK